jgi:O-methyltransferase
MLAYTLSLSSLQEIVEMSNVTHPSEITPLKVALRVAARRLAGWTRARRPMRFPTYPPQVAHRIEQYHDDVRYASIALAIQRLETDNIQGSFAEVGVFRGATSAFIHKQAPGRRYFLFDTFEGFPAKDLEVASDTRFQQTSQAAVAEYIGGNENLTFRVGYFPETAAGLEDEKFAFVMLDVDIYQASLDVFKFFYPRLVRGGYFFMHDFNSPESNRAVSRAAVEFMADKPEMLIEISDYFGSALFRKI